MMMTPQARIEAGILGAFIVAFDEVADLLPRLVAAGFGDERNCAIWSAVSKVDADSTAHEAQQEVYGELRRISFEDWAHLSAVSGAHVSRERVESLIEQLRARGAA